MQQELTMGSLFSGSGGFELASAIFGIEPRWASEIEPLPMLITKKNLSSKTKQIIRGSVLAMKQISQFKKR